MANKLGLHVIPVHGRQEDVDYAAAVNPSVIKFVDADQHRVLQYAERVPGAVLFLRDWALSEQKEDMRRDPEGTGKRHAEEWLAKLSGQFSAVPRSRVVVSGINEPEVWVDFSVVPYTVAFLNRLSAGGVKGAALNLSVGWPANNGENRPPDWEPYAPVLGAIKNGNHYLCVHEYWDERGVGYNWGWWAGRVNRCPWNVPIIIGECGIDKYVADPSVTPHKRGWQGWITADMYASQVKEYLHRLDERVVAATVYTTDYSHPWQSFDTFPASKALSQVYVEQGKGYASIPTEPQPAIRNVVHPLPRSLLTQHWGENGDIYAKFGLWGHNGTDYAASQGAPVRCAAEGVVAWVDYDEDYGYYVRVNHQHLGVDTFYAHLSKVAVNKGEKLLATSIVGFVGSTGNSTGPHLHFEVRMRDSNNAGYAKSTPMPKGRIDPETWLALHGAWDNT
jgi:murein DD-endopeptidase MepM/ murein hydrolase activator NlpD